ncbi:unnamed protein product [Rotaria sordida]|uniref:Secreted protein n=1 Tax=Rotaria sordida TaxID=392033 RepID=A0A815S076_9BILA|nr:unnamed protein product [Rotaria sordida]CAF1648911.1 unnamed protein product [Rotaria sordida]
MYSNYFVLILFIRILPIWSYQLKTCCSTEKMTTTNTTRPLSCPLNFVIKLRSVIFYMGNGCALSSCQRRLNKHYLLCIIIIEDDQFLFNVFIWTHHNVHG